MANGRRRDVRNWPKGLCEWLLDYDSIDSIFNSLAKMSGLWTEEVNTLLEQQVPMLRRLHQASTEGGSVYLSVPVELERQPEAALRQQMSLMQDEDAKTKYDYISFVGSSATLSRKMRRTIAHLHVALGHIGADKLCRTLALNGAKESVITAVKNLRCGVCSQVVSPTPPPKVSFKRPSSFYERVCVDTFFVWDAQSLKYAVTHLVDAFSLYQVAIVSKDPSAAAHPDWKVLVSLPRGYPEFVQQFLARSCQPVLAQTWSVLPKGALG